MMRRWLRTIWRELTRERAWPHTQRRRARRDGRSSRAGIALLLVVSIIAMLTVVVTEVVSTASVRIQLAAHQRDEAKAEALANGGIQFYRLLLIASQQLQASPAVAMLAQMVPGAQNATQLWQVLPSIDSGLLRMLVFTGGDEDDAAEIIGRGGMTAAQRAEADAQVETSLRKSFLDFDGDFTASVIDEERKIWVRKFNVTDMNGLQQDIHARLLASMMSTEEDDRYLREKGLERWELIGDLADWSDVDDMRIWDGSRETAVYERMDLDEPYLPKNTDFDTIDEIRLVNGWHRDNIWHRFGQNLTIYGAGKVNINTAERPVIEALLKQFIQPSPTDDDLDFMIRELEQCRSLSAMEGGCVFTQPQQFVSILEQIARGTVDPALANAIQTQSGAFRVTSTGKVGQAKVSVEAVFQFPPGNFAGQVVYWRVE